MTQRLYLHDPYLLEFDATVVARREHEGRPAVVLDRHRLLRRERRAALGHRHPRRRACRRGGRGRGRTSSTSSTVPSPPSGCTGSWTRTAGATTCSSTTASTCCRRPSSRWPRRRRSPSTSAPSSRRSTSTASSARSRCGPPSAGRTRSCGKRRPVRVSTVSAAQARAEGLGLPEGVSRERAHRRRRGLRPPALRRHPPAHDRRGRLRRHQRAREVQGRHSRVLRLRAPSARRGRAAAGSPRPPGVDAVGPPRRTGGHRAEGEGRPPRERAAREEPPRAGPRGRRAPAARRGPRRRTGAERGRAFRGRGGVRRLVPERPPRPRHPPRRPRPVRGPPRQPRRQGPSRLRPVRRPSPRRPVAPQGRGRAPRGEGRRPREHRPGGRRSSRPPRRGPGPRRGGRPGARRRPMSPWLTLSLAVVFVSFGAILVRLAAAPAARRLVLPRGARVSPPAPVRRSRRAAIVAGARPEASGGCSSRRAPPSPCTSRPGSRASRTRPSRPPSSS